MIAMHSQKTCWIQERNSRHSSIYGMSNLNETVDSTFDGYKTVNESECLDNYCDWTEQTFKEEITKSLMPKPYEWFFFALFAYVFLSGIIGNFLVVYSVWKNKHLQTVTNYFLVNLSCADFLVILICLPPTLVHDIMESWFLGVIMCKIISYFQVRFNSCSLISVYILHKNCTLVIFPLVRLRLIRTI